MTGSHGCSGSVYAMIHSCQVSIALKLINNEPQHNPPKKKKKQQISTKGNVTLPMKMARAAFWSDRRPKNKDVTWQQVQGGIVSFPPDCPFFVLLPVRHNLNSVFFFRAIVDRHPRKHASSFTRLFPLHASVSLSTPATPACTLTCWQARSESMLRLTCKARPRSFGP